MSPHALTTAVLLALAAYLLGSVPVGLLVGRARGVDIRTVGSKNIGATNVGRTLGRPWGMLVFAADVLKGLVPTLSAGAILAAGEAESSMTEVAWNLWVLGVGVAAVLGHNYSVFLRFSGGKGVATSLGVALGVYPDLTCAALVALGVWATVTLVSRYVSLGSLCAAVAFPLSLVLLFGHQQDFWVKDWPLFACSSLLAVMIFYRHRGNILRLFRGTEQKIGEVR